MSDVHMTECDGCKRREAGNVYDDLRLWRTVKVMEDAQHRDVTDYTLCPRCVRRFKEVVVL